jgi:putative transposase
MNSRGNPYHNARAESFMKTRKVEEVYLAGTRRLRRWRRDCRGSSKRSTTPSYCTRRSGYRPPNEFES